jgi:hypothetical protein
MKLKFLSILILVVLFLGLLVYGYFQSTPNIEKQTGNLPKIEITPKIFDFGSIEYGQVLRHTFRVKNIGSEILEIKRVATSCACTTAKIALDKINPGQETDLYVTYDTGAMSGPHGRGRQERIIYVKSSDPINPQTEVTIYANVR